MRVSLLVGLMPMPGHASLGGPAAGGAPQVAESASPLGPCRATRNRLLLETDAAAQSGKETH